MLFIAKSSIKATLQPLEVEKTAGTTLIVNAKASFPLPVVRLVGAGVSIIKANFPQMAVKAAINQRIPITTTITIAESKIKFFTDGFDVTLVPLVKLNAAASFPMFASRIRGGYPNRINAVASFPLPAPKIDVKVPFGVRSTLGFPGVELAARLFIPPFEVSGRIGFEPLRLVTTIVQPPRIKTKLGMPAMSMRASVAMEYGFDGVLGFAPMSVKGEAFIAPYVDSVIGFKGMTFLGEVDQRPPTIDAAIGFPSMFLRSMIVQQDPPLGLIAVLGFPGMQTSARLEQPYSLESTLGFPGMTMYARLVNREASDEDGLEFDFPRKSRSIFIEF